MEGWSSTEETQRAKALWLELLEKPIPERKAWPGPSAWLESGLLDMSWISQQWWPKDGVIILSYIDVFLAVPEVLNVFLWLLQRSLEIVWNCFEHVWRNLRRTSRVSRKQRLLTNFLWLHAFFHGTACYCFLWLLRNDARGSSQFSELVEMCDSRCQWLHCDSTFWMIQFTL